MFPHQGRAGAAHHLRTVALAPHDTALASRCGRRLSLAGGRLVDDAALIDARSPAAKA